VSNVLRFPKAPDDAVRGPLESDRPKWDDCKHPRPLVLDVEAHELRCGKCGQRLDAFDFLLDLTYKWERYNTGYRSARDQERAAVARVALLKRAERNAKQRIRKRGVVLTHAQAKTVRAQLSALQHLAVDAVGQEEAVRRSKLMGVDPEKLREAYTILNEQIEFDRERRAG
jgi:hypothetical protein